MRIELQTHDLHLVALQRVQTLSVVGVPDLGCAVEGARHDFIAAGEKKPAYP